MERRTFVKSAGIITAAASLNPTMLSGNSGKAGVAGNDVSNAVALEFPALPYAYDALEPYIDARTMELHYDKHHRAYYTNFMNAVKGTPAENQALPGIFATVSKYPDAIRNNGGGFYNHTIFWNNLSKEPGKPSSDLSSAIDKAFGSFDKFKETFSNAAKTRFGSGWAWLVLTPDKKLAVGSTGNQDNPLMDISQFKGTPLLTLDVWEHAYYLKYQNRRPEYIDAFWNVVNWNEVNRRYSEGLKS
ncbi:MAG TPA: superoxide dismutase [Bacteroidales bacterium]|nr:superoxide dismutase [Bacteroidales bacterium]